MMLSASGCEMCALLVLRFSLMGLEAREDLPLSDSASDQTPSAHHDL